MIEQVLRFLRCASGGLFVDGTLGTGGHALAILQNSPATARVVGIDRDLDSIRFSRERLKPYSNRVHLVQGKFGDLPAILSRLGIGEVDGILLDLGFSSRQLETGARGFSFQRQDPLDMRMDQSEGHPVREWLARTHEQELTRVLREYGEERWAPRIARRILAHLADNRLETTADLASLVSQAIPRRYWPKHIHPATRTFQALRIFINDELGQLNLFLDHFVWILKRGGRACLISYHSLEDRLIKQSFLRWEGKTPSAELTPGPLPEKGLPVFKRVLSKPERPAPEEIEQNPRARSAKLRVGERIQ
jgi:16S rRNA (cytosine1402-N4)-methyltransferase